MKKFVNIIKRKLHHPKKTLNIQVKGMRWLCNYTYKIKVIYFEFTNLKIMYFYNFFNSHCYQIC